MLHIFQAQSVKDMVEEAKKIAIPGSEPIHKMRRKSMFRKDGVKKGKGT